MADAWDELIARHGLTFAEAVRIRDEVGAGRAFAEPHVRAAAAEWARHLLEREGFARLWASGWRRIVLVVSLVVLLAEIVRGLLDVHAGAHPSGLRLGMLALLIAANVLAAWNRRRLLRATITRNEEPPRGGDHLR